MVQGNCKTQLLEWKKLGNKTTGGGKDQKVAVESDGLTGPDW
jgi:hypothetical protein